MPVPIDFIRAVLGVLFVFFAHLLGRSAARVYRGERPRSLFGWSVRTALTGLAVSWRFGLDGVMIAILAGAAVSAGVGGWLELRSKAPEEDLTEQMFPPD